MRGRWIRMVCVCAASSALLGWAGVARAQDAAQVAAAQAIFERGVELLEGKQYADACPKLEEAARLNPGGVGIKVRLAECYEGAGRLASAWLSYTQVQIAAHEAQQLPNRPADKKRQDAEREQTAATKISALKARLSNLTIAGPPTPPSGVSVTRDGVQVGPGQWGIAVPVDGGKHTIAASAPGRKPWSATVDVPVERGSVTVTVPDLVVLAPEAPPVGALSPPVPLVPAPPAPALHPRAGGVPTWAWVTGGAGIALLGVGAGFGAAALGAQSAINTACGGNANACTGAMSTVDPLTTRQDRDRDIFIGLAAVGGAGLVAGLVGVATAPRAKATAPGQAVLVLPFASQSGGGMAVTGGF